MFLIHSQAASSIASAAAPDVTEPKLDISADIMAYAEATANFDKAVKQAAKAKLIKHSVGREFLRAVAALEQAVEQQNSSSNQFIDPTLFIILVKTQPQLTQSVLTYLNARCRREYNSRWVDVEDGLNTFFQQVVTACNLRAEIARSNSLDYLAGISWLTVHSSSEKVNTDAITTLESYLQYYKCRIKNDFYNEHGYENSKAITFIHFALFSIYSFSKNLKNSEGAQAHAETLIARCNTGDLNPLRYIQSDNPYLVIYGLKQALHLTTELFGEDQYPVLRLWLIDAYLQLEPQADFVEVIVESAAKLYKEASRRTYRYTNEWASLKISAARILIELAACPENIAMIVNAIVQMHQEAVNKEHRSMYESVEHAAVHLLKELNSRYPRDQVIEAALARVTSSSAKAIGEFKAEATATSAKLTEPRTSASGCEVKLGAVPVSEPELVHDLKDAEAAYAAKNSRLALTLYGQILTAAITAHDTDRLVQVLKPIFELGIVLPEQATQLVLKAFEYIQENLDDLDVADSPLPQMLVDACTFLPITEPLRTLVVELGKNAPEVLMTLAERLLEQNRHHTKPSTPERAQQDHEVEHVIDHIIAALKLNPESILQDRGILILRNIDKHIVSVTCSPTVRDKARVALIIYSPLSSVYHDRVIELDSEVKINPEAREHWERLLQWEDPEVLVFESRCALGKAHPYKDGAMFEVNKKHQSKPDFNTAIKYLRILYRSSMPHIKKTQLSRDQYELVASACSCVLDAREKYVEARKYWFNKPDPAIGVELDKLCSIYLPHFPKSHWSNPQKRLEELAKKGDFWARDALQGEVKADLTEMAQTFAADDAQPSLLHDAAGEEQEEQSAPLTRAPSFMLPHTKSNINAIAMGGLSSDDDEITVVRLQAKRVFNPSRYAKLTTPLLGVVGALPETKFQIKAALKPANKEAATTPELKDSDVSWQDWETQRPAQNWLSIL